MLSGTAVSTFTASFKFERVVLILKLIDIERSSYLVHLTDNKRLFRSKSRIGNCQWDWKRSHIGKKHVVNILWLNEKKKHFSSRLWTKAKPCLAKLLINVVRDALSCKLNYFIICRGEAERAQTMTVAAAQECQWNQYNAAWFSSFTPAWFFTGSNCLIISQR